MSKPLFIHTIGIEGCGHHFWWTYLDTLLKIVAKNNHKTFYHNMHREIREGIQDIYYKWNNYTKITNDTPKEELYEKLRTTITTKYNDSIMWICDSYPTMKLRRPSQNMDFVEIYEKLKDIMDIKYIVITRDFFYSVNARKYLDKDVYDHATNMADHLVWINNKLPHIDKEDYITIDYNSIEKSLPQFAEFLNIDYELCHQVFKQVFKKSKKIITKGFIERIRKKVDTHIKNTYEENKYEDIIKLLKLNN